MTDPLRESDDTEYDAPVHIDHEDGDGTVECTNGPTTMQIVNKRMKEHPVWTGATAGVCVAFLCFVGAWVLNQHNAIVRQPATDHLQDLEIETLAEKTKAVAKEVTEMGDDVQKIQLTQVAISTKLSHLKESQDEQARLTTELIKAVNNLKLNEGQ